MAVQIVKLLDSLNNTVITGGLVPKGTYNALTAYATGDSVSYNGSSYVAIAATTGNLPTDTTKWQVIANKGDTGSAGSTGSAATVAVGSTTTGAAGSSAVVANSGTTSAAVLDFTIPRGNTGATGSTGATGPASAWGTIPGTLSSQTDLQTALNAKAAKSFTIAMSIAL